MFNYFYVFSRINETCRPTKYVNKGHNQDHFSFSNKYFIIFAENVKPSIPLIMTEEEKDVELERLRIENQKLKENNKMLIEGSEKLVARNMMLSEKMDIYYDVRRRVEWLKELVRRHRELMVQADLRDDEELLALIEARLEGDEIPLPPEYGLREVAELVGTTQQRIVDLYKQKTIYHTVDKYLDYLRLLRALRLLKERPAYNIEAIATDAGFNSVRTMHRKIIEAIGMTPGQFRDLTSPSDL
jgi:AraC-like DNA-binding protein